MDDKKINNSDILENEKNALRSELQHLKNCQLQYFLVSITTTGVFLTLAGTLGKSLWIYLAPLIVIIPCWWIFFDKAATITRIVGYYRVLEDISLGKSYDYVGWENALGGFRTKERNGTEPFNEPIEEETRCFWDKVKKLVTYYRYWAIHWITFVGLSVLCMTLGVVNFPWCSNSPWPTYFIAISVVILVLFSAWYTWQVYLTNLAFGKHSYSWYEKSWRKLLTKGENSLLMKTS